MAVEMEIVYEGDLRSRAKHGPSGQMIATDAPVDNGGKGAAFSPTDLVGAALGACMLTIMGKVADRNGIDLRGTKVRVTKEMASEPVRRIKRLGVVLTLPPGLKLSAENRAKLENAAHTCPVKQSLHPGVMVDIVLEG
jgi:putative redox protein